MAFKIAKEATQQELIDFIVKRLLKKHADLDFLLIDFSKEHFEKRVSESILQNQIDFAVQKISEIPEELPDGLALAAILSFKNEGVGILCRMSDELVFALLRELADKKLEHQILAQRYFQ